MLQISMMRSLSNGVEVASYTHRLGLQGMGVDGVSGQPHDSKSAIDDKGVGDFTQSSS